MTKKTLIYWSSILLFMVLFYHQYLGLNLMIFAIFISVTAFLTSNLKPTKNLIIYWICLFLSGIGTIYFGDFFSIFWQIILLLLLPFFYFETKENNLIFSIVKSTMNYFFSISQLVAKSDENRKENKIKNFFLKFILFAIVPIVLISIFIALYTQVNSDFNELFLSFKWPKLDFAFFVLFFLANFLLFGLWHYHSYFYFSKYLGKYLKEDLVLDETNNNANNENFNLLTISGIWLFILLNLTLLFFLCFEIHTVFFTNFFKNPDQFSKEVHGSINAVIISIVLAILLIMIYLGGKLNFNKNHKYLKLSVFIWIGFNALLIFVSYIKNQSYINYYGLTLKRLGVIAFLLLALIGLFFTIYKTRYNKTNYFLIRHMNWTFLIFLSAICPINWSGIVTKYNIHQFENHKIQFDVFYHIDDLDYNGKIIDKALKNDNNFKQALIKSRQDELYDLSAKKTKKDLNKKLNRKNFREWILYYQFINSK